MIKFKLNKKGRNWLIAILVIIVFSFISVLRPDQDFSKKYEGVDLSFNTMSSSSLKSYSQYLKEHLSAKNAKSSLKVDILSYDATNSNGVSIVQDDLVSNEVLLTQDRSNVTWTFDVVESGFYNLQMSYLCVPSRNVSMERILRINGEVPFSGADLLTFNRLWKDGTELKYDNQGNVIRPTQKEVFALQTVRFKSDSGYETEPYVFYFEQGTNTISLESTNEPMKICSLSLEPKKEILSYDEYLKKQKTSFADESKSIKLTIQGEDSVVRSDPSLFSRYDRSSALTIPYSVKNTILNYAGGESWKAPGQWIEWDVEVPEDGWYTISFKARQLYQRGLTAYRSVYIDGEIPLQELKAVAFPYTTDWKLNTLSDKEQKPLNFYLTKGTHKIRLEATLGEVGSIISEMEQAIFRLNKIYRTILVLTGTLPDQFRDYEIEKIYPDEYEQMNIESKRLYYLVDKYIKITGEKSNLISPAETLAVQLGKFYKNPDKIPKGFIAFRDNITSLGAAMLTLTESKLDIDLIDVQSSNKKIKKVRKNIFKTIKHEIISFATSFMVDSSSLGNVYDEDEEHTISVWITTGRDQSQILKNMIDDSFTPETGIKVNVKLILIDSLLNAVVAGNGPDVVLSVYSSAPVDYALRNANVNLMRFPDCQEVMQRFKPSAYEPYLYDGGLYALPETETFNLLFYRKDILEQLEIEVPQTWEDFENILPTLQGNNFQAGIPYPNLTLPDMTTYYSMVFQKGGKIYNPTGTRTLIDSEEGIGSFKTYTGFFNDYGLPTIYDFLSRFRTGEMPIGISNYQTYNTLAVGAPEIRGLWDFSYILGTKKEDGSIDRSSVASSICAMMIKKGMDLDDLDLANSKEIIYSAFNGAVLEDGIVPGIDQRTWEEIQRNETRLQDSWKFMKWWTSEEAQVRFGRELEAVLGSSARYPTANVEALKQLSWKSSQLEVLLKSLDETVGVPEVPGSYYTPRHVVNATRKVVNDREDSREVLIDYTRKINEEIKRKRQEFNLPIE